MIVVTIHEDGSKFHVHRVVDGVSTDITHNYECRYFPLEDARGRVDGFHVGRRVGQLAGKAAVVPSFAMPDDRAVGKEL